MTMVKVLVGSENPVKIDAVKEAFGYYFDAVDVKGIVVPSFVPEQPVNSQTFEGAKNRAIMLRKANAAGSLGADYCVGIEGGIAEIYSRWFVFGSMCVLDTKGRMSFGISPHVEVLQQFLDDLLAGVELNVLSDRLTGEENIGQKQGIVGFLTKDVLKRKDFYVSGLIMALVPFVNEKLYF